MTPHELQVAVGADHGGFAHKSELLPWLKEQGFAVTDCGAFELNSDDDYPVFAKQVAEVVTAHQGGDQGERTVGVLLCRSGAGMAMAANRFPGVRAVSVTTPEQASHARAHNDANVIVLSGDWLDLDQMKQCVETFLNTPFSGEDRHQRRIAQLDHLTDSSL